MRQLFFVIPFAVEPKQSVKSRIITPKRGKPFVHHYQPKAIELHKERLILEMKNQCPTNHEPMDGTIEATFRFCWEWPKGMRNADKIGAPILRDTKPDTDNCSKPLCDALQDAGVIVNDSRIARSIIETCWWHTPCIMIRLRQVPKRAGYLLPELITLSDK